MIMTDAGMRIIIVEDEPLISMMTEDYLDLLGHQPVGTADSIESAMRLIETVEFDTAIIDVNLRAGEKCWPIADALAEAGKPFILASGSGGDDIEPAHRDRPILSKPFTMEHIKSAIAALNA